jgi:hypothetical protein
MAVAAENNGVGLGRCLRLPIDRDRHPLTKNEDGLDRVTFDLDDSDATAHRHSTGRCVKCNVLFLADFTANVAKHAGRQGRGEIARLFLRVVDKLVDDDFGVLGDRQCRLIGEKQLRLTGALRVDLLVANDVVANQKFSPLVIRRLTGNVRVDFGGDTNFFRVGERRPTQAYQPERHERHAVQRARHTVSCDTPRGGPEWGNPDQTSFHPQRPADAAKLLAEPQIQFIEIHPGVDRSTKFSIERIKIEF